MAKVKYTKASKNAEGLEFSKSKFCPACGSKDLSPHWTPACGTLRMHQCFKGGTHFGTAGSY